MSFQQINLITENQTFSKIMGNGNRYEVPLFQRDYSWEKDQVNELWDDIKQMKDQKTQHFMGYLVFQDSDRKCFGVIDGQQRLTTIMLIYIAGLNRLEELINTGKSKKTTKANQVRLELYRQTYIGVTNGVTLKKDKKLKLNKNNRDHFNDLTEDYEPPVRRGITKTNRRINQAFELFNIYFKNINTGKKIAELFNAIADGLIFTVIKVTNELNAYMVFETLNARGIQLSAPDLLKNYLLSLLHQEVEDDEELNEFGDRWAEIITQLGKNNFTDFLRSHMGTFQTLPNKKEIFRHLKQNINSPNKVEPFFAEIEKTAPFFAEIEKTAPFFAALQQYDDSFWRDHFPDHAESIRKSLKALNIFNIKTPLSLLIAVQQKLPIEDFVSVLDWIKNLSIRYNVIGQKASNDQEPIYNKIAQNVTNEQWQKEEIKNALKPLYIKDKIFKDDFLNKSIPSRQTSKKIVYLLTQIEANLPKGRDIVGLTVEHILPYNPNSQWQEDFGVDEYSSAIDRLGNMTLLTSKQNRKLGQKPWNEKKEYFAKSDLKLHQKLASYNEWDIDAVRNYQQFLANKAIGIWKIQGME